MFPKDSLVKFRTIANKKRYVSKYWKSAAMEILHSKTTLSWFLWLECLPIQCCGLARKLYALQVQPRELHGDQCSGLWPCGKCGPCRDPGDGTALEWEGSRVYLWTVTKRRFSRSCLHSLNRVICPLMKEYIPEQMRKPGNTQPNLLCFYVITALTDGQRKTC